MDKLMIKKRWRRIRRFSAAGGHTTKVSLMYPNEKKEMMVVFDEKKRTIGVALTQDVFRNASKVDENTNTAIISYRKLKRILRPKEYYFNSQGYLKN